MGRHSCKFFSFQAEDGIRDGHVTGVQTCALPILKAVVSHWAVAALTSNSVISRGRATLITVSLRIITNEAMSRTPMTSLTCAGMVSSGVVVASVDAADRWSVVMVLLGKWSGKGRAAPRCSSALRGAASRAAE